MDSIDHDPLKGFLYSLGGVVLLSSNFVTAKYALQGFNPETFSLVWTSAAALYSFGIAAAVKSSRSQLFPRQSMREMTLMGFATAVCMVFAWTGLSVLDPVFSSFLWRFFPVLAIFAGVFFLKERITRNELFAMMIMLSGSLWSVAGRWESVGKGVILTLLAGCAGALQLLIAKSQTGLVHANVLAAYRVGIGAAFIALWVFASNKADFSVEARYWYVTLFGAFLGPCASFLLTFRSYRYWTLAQSSIVLVLQPLLVLPLTYAFLRTLPCTQELFGGLVILFGALWLTIGQIKKSR